jgi:hypothetical protein
VFSFVNAHQSGRREDLVVGQRLNPDVAKFHGVVVVLEQEG